MNANEEASAHVPTSASARLGVSGPRSESEERTPTRAGPPPRGKDRPRVYRLGDAAVQELLTLILSPRYPLRLTHNALRAMRIHTALRDPNPISWRVPILMNARAQRVSGITLGADVFLAHPSLIRNWPLIAHEAAHVVQSARLQLIPFLVNYSWQWSKRRLQGLDGHAAYLAIPDEVEARAIERRAASIQTLSHPWLIELPM